MRRAPISALLGPAFVLYLIADAASAQGELDPPGALLSLIAAALALTRIAVGRDADLPGASATAWLGLASGLTLVRIAAPAALSWPLDLVQVVALCASSALLVELALTVPDPIGPSGRRMRLMVRGVAAVVAIPALAAHAPPVQLVGAMWIAPASWALLPAYLFGATVLLSLVLRLARRRLGSSPEALASNTWAVFGLVPVAVLSVAAVVASALGVAVEAPAARIASGLCVAVLIVGHLRLIDPTRRLSVGPTTRDAVAAVATLLLVAGVAVGLRQLWPRAPLPLLATAVGTLLVAVVLYRMARELSRVVLAPYSGQLLSALRAGHVGLGMVRSLDELAGAALGCARQAAAAPASEPLLYIFDPELEYRLDAAGLARTQAGPPHPELLRALRERPGEIILRAPLEAQLVRNPPLRPLIQALTAVDALCVVPLVLDGELEGALVLPRGARRATLSLEEIDALHRYALHVAGYLGVLTGEARAQARAGGLLRGKQQAEAEVESLRTNLDLANADRRALRVGGSLERVEEQALRYSPAMRTLLERLEAVADMEVPVLFVAERGIDPLPICRQLHARSPRAEEAFVLGACADVPPEGTELSVFGDGTAATPGWLRLARGGVLVLTDPTALASDVQQRLAQALAEAGAAGPRVIACTRLDPDELALAGAMEESLRERFPIVLRLPPLREREEDLASLTLLAIDRACRVLGRPTVGIAPEAQAALTAHDWPGNVEELQAVIEQAVTSAQGPRINPGDLPILGATAAGVAAPHPLDGSFESVERRVLAHALERADGNKSGAARLLGLKRTTFLDKLRRHGLDDGPKARASTPPPN
ncbi:MAG: sigma 54-interacting transcriptional regulator [Myxococcales bacterium]|nr:sigma 54-interacting transcriptional regulator [Myxococcales bacterium]